MAKVALIHILGNISYESDSVVLLESFINSDPTSGYEGLICWINSGGGSLCAAQDLVALLHTASLPSVAVAGEMCASAAYYLALGFDRIIARPASLIGGLCSSIEVANHCRFYERAGIAKQCHSKGSLKGMLSPHVPEMAPGERDAINDILVELDDQFHRFLGERRPHAALTELTDGRLVAGMSAQHLGLIDDLGGIVEAKVTLARILNVAAVEVELIEAEETRPVARASAGMEIHQLMASLPKL